jgi:adenosylmethionine-8-amino-7-oxononanoate aminotransferase
MLMGAGGMRMWDASMLAEMRAAAATHGVIFIADEVLTGFGRTGPLFACQHAGITPDVMCLSKGITGGVLPLGATLVSAEIFGRFVSSDPGHTLFHGHSYTANPLACAAAVASIALLDDACARRRGGIEALHHAAADRFRRIPRASGVRVMGTVLAFEIDGAGGYLDPVGARLRAFALDRGVLLRPLGNTVYVLPPYCATADDLERTYDVIAEFLEHR